MYIVFEFSFVSMICTDVSCFNFSGLYLLIIYITMNFFCANDLTDVSCSCRPLPRFGPGGSPGPLFTFFQHFWFLVSKSVALIMYTLYHYIIVLTACHFSAFLIFSFNVCGSHYACIVSLHYRIDRVSYFSIFDF